MGDIFVTPAQCAEKYVIYFYHNGELKMIIMYIHSQTGATLCQASNAWPAFYTLQRAKSTDKHT